MLYQKYHPETEISLWMGCWRDRGTLCVKTQAGIGGGDLKFQKSEIYQPSHENVGKGVTQLSNAHENSIQFKHNFVMDVSVLRLVKCTRHGGYGPLRVKSTKTYFQLFVQTCKSVE